MYRVHCLVIPKKRVDTPADLKPDLIPLFRDMIKYINFLIEKQVERRQRERERERKQRGGETEGQRGTQGYRGWREGDQMRLETRGKRDRIGGGGELSGYPRKGQTPLLTSSQTSFPSSEHGQTHQLSHREASGHGERGGVGRPDGERDGGKERAIPEEVRDRREGAIERPEGEGGDEGETMDLPHTDTPYSLKGSGMHSPSTKRKVALPMGYNPTPPKGELISSLTLSLLDANWLLYSRCSSLLGAKDCTRVRKGITEMSTYPRNSPHLFY